jgi:hypothetical protein
MDTNITGNMDTNITGNMDTHMVGNMDISMVDIIKENIMENMRISIEGITKDITVFR